MNSAANPLSFRVAKSIAAVVVFPLAGLPTKFTSIVIHLKTLSIHQTGALTRKRNFFLRGPQKRESFLRWVCRLRRTIPGRTMAQDEGLDPARNSSGQGRLPGAS